MLNCRRLYCSAASTLEKSNFDIYAGVAICRYPIVAPKFNDIQEKYVRMQKEIEAENSYKSDFELRTERDLKLLEKKKQLEAEGKDLSQLEGELGITTMMQEEEWERRKASCVANYGIDRSAGEDNANLKGLLRHFDSKLLLLVRQKFADTDAKYESPWILPQCKNTGESLRETAEKCVDSLFTSRNMFYIRGNAPFWHITYKYPKRLQTKVNTVGAKVFIYQCVVRDAFSLTRLNQNIVADHQWSTLEELSSAMKEGNKYYPAARHLLNE